IVGRDRLCSRGPGPHHRKARWRQCALHAGGGIFARASPICVSELLLKVAVSYLLGSIIGGLLIGRLRGGVDIRQMGSGNAGGTNALRTQGKWFAFWVLLIDIGKGWLAAGIV